MSRFIEYRNRAWLGIPCTYLALHFPSFWFKSVVYVYLDCTPKKATGHMQWLHMLFCMMLISTKEATVTWRSPGYLMFSVFYRPQLVIWWSYASLVTLPVGCHEKCSWWPQSWISARQSDQNILQTFCVWMFVLLVFQCENTWNCILSWLVGSWKNKEVWRMS